MTKYITLGIDNITKDKWKEPENIGFIKPYGGLWASKYTPDEEYVSKWHRFIKIENFGNADTCDAVVFSLTEDVRIYTIDSSEDLEVLMENYQFNGENLFTKSLDFEKLAKDYDVIELTENGQSSTRFSRPYSLYGWDIECILILNINTVDSQEKIIVDNK